MPGLSGARMRCCASSELISRHCFSFNIFTSQLPESNLAETGPASKSFRRLEFHFLCHRLAVFVAQMPVSAHRQSSAVFVPQPPGNRRNIHARFDAPSGKQMPQVVMCELGDPNDRAGFGQSVIALSNLHHPATCLAGCTFEPAEQLFHIPDDG